MGLDMYLTGDRLIHSRSRERGQKKGEWIDLGYWRKHPNLHGYIVESFADGKDECQRIHLSIDYIHMILAAIEAEDLPATSGFFFGESDGSEKDRDLRTFRDALSWLEADDPKAWRSIYYQ